MLKINLLEQMLIISIALSTISCSFVQKTKSYFPCSICLFFYSLFVNIVMGLLFCISFTSITFPMSLWIGVFSFLGADTIYKSLEGKLTPYREILNKNVVEVPKENIIYYACNDCCYTNYFY